VTYSRNLLQRLRLGGEWCREQAQGERDDAPNDAPPHGLLLSSASCRPLLCFCLRRWRRTLRLRHSRQRERGTSGRCLPSPAAGCSARSPRPVRLPRCAPHAYWITSSARRSRDGGIVIPSALAVLRLMTSSNFTGRSTGRSAGFAPLRILST